MAAVLQTTWPQIQMHIFNENCFISIQISLKCVLMFLIYNTWAVCYNNGGNRLIWNNKLQAITGGYVLYNIVNLR